MTGGGRPLFGEASFRDWALYQEDLVGLHPYEAVLSDPEFLWVVLPNTFILMILSEAAIV